MKIVNLAQQSKDWLLWRQAGLGSSDAPAIVGKSKWTTARQVWEEKVSQREGGVREKKESSGGNTNWAMRRGTRLEPVARDLYEQLMGWEVKPLCCVHDQYPWLKASLDGFNPALGLVIEIKAPNKDDHGLALRGDVPEHYKPQVDHLLLVSEAQRLHYVSYNPGFATHEQLAIVTWLPTRQRLQELFEAEQQFWTCVEMRTPPQED